MVEEASPALRQIRSLPEPALLSSPIFYKCSQPYELSGLQAPTIDLLDDVFMDAHHTSKPQFTRGSTHLSCRRSLCVKKKSIDAPPIFLNHVSIDMGATVSPRMHDHYVHRIKSYPCVYLAMEEPLFQGAFRQLRRSQTNRGTGRQLKERTTFRFHSPFFR